MGIAEAINKEAGKYYGIMILAALVGGGAFFLTQKLEIAAIVGAITIIVLWLKVLTDDLDRIKKKLCMGESE